MKRRRISLVAALTAASVMAVASAAFAVNSWTVNNVVISSDTVISGVVGGSVNLQTDYSVPISCGSGAMSGLLKAVVLNPGNKVATIGTAYMGTIGSPCSATSFNLPVLVEKGAAADWNFYPTATPGKGSPTLSLEARNVNLRVHSVGPTPWVCDLRLTGTVPARVTRSSQLLAFNAPTSYPLTITAYDGSGTNTPGTGITCGGQIYTGDVSSISGGFTASTSGGAIGW